MPNCEHPLPRARHRRQHADDRGSTAVELALAVPILLTGVLLILVCLRAGAAHIDVTSAASAAARAAAAQRTPALADTAARDSATTSLAGLCQGVTVAVDASRFARGGAVTVTVTCTADLHHLTGINLPGQITTTQTATSPIDLWRQEPNP
ncbi:TadE/TadG family type IV pilus assembly protein [Catellatospora sp. KI3]|uniref:TadE/TadG family type IV pilus assembly protein n=1 Tax=Catellatospora sp. KI3 TaxID=3041620 RepID=UPI002482303B|nr:TadE/TadG family type IV pilus assembly protein [Catellatospora sp. KI3]MDI1461027.1 TadE/TadG family type IV pilus assembly protein [Catellatospora sp. KI3]